MGYINVAMDQHAQGIDLKRASEPQGWGGHGNLLTFDISPELHMYREEPKDRMDGKVELWKATFSES